MGKLITLLKTLWRIAVSAKRWAEGKPAPKRPVSDDENARAAKALPRKKAEAQDPVGYLINRQDGLTGSQGTGYDYVWAGNGLFVQSRYNLLNARVKVNNTPTPGLRDTVERITLEMGKIPLDMIERGVQWAAEDPNEERYFAIRWDGKAYALETPPQRGTGASVTFQSPPVNTVAEFHSHGRFPPHFSETDNADEQAFRIYGVIGQGPDGEPQLNLRVGIYGHHGRISMNDIAAEEEEQQ